MARIDDLHTIAFTLTELMVQAENAHLLEHWQMIFGSVVIPELVKEDPKILDAHPEFKVIVDAYSKEEVLAKLAPKVEKVVETKVETKEVEVVKVVEKKVPVTVAGGSERKDPGHATCSDGGKHRRLKEGVHKIKRFERHLTCSDRDHIITWWNKEQRLVPKKDPICQKLADEINGTSGSEPLSASQVAGYLSRLADWGRLSSGKRTSKFDKHIGIGAYTVRPVFSPEFVKALIANYEAEQEDLRIRKAAHAKMLAEKTGASAPVSSEEPTVTIVAPEEPTITGEVEPAAPEASTEEVEVPAVESDDVDITFA